MSLKAKVPVYPKLHLPPLTSFPWKVESLRPPLASPGNVSSFEEVESDKKFALIKRVPCADQGDR